MRKWISVNKRLPKQDVDNASVNLLIAIQYRDDSHGEHRTLCTGYLLENEWWTYGDHSCHKIGDTYYSGDKVTHWMPLPKPPKTKEMQK